MSVKQLHNIKELKEIRKELRKNMTPAEIKFWTLAKNKQIAGIKFRRQHSINRYVVDFYCASEKLIIELDGESHRNAIREQSDLEKDETLRMLGYRVLRFSNSEVFHQTEYIIEQIKRSLKNS